MVARKSNVNWSFRENISFEPNDGASAGLLNTPSLECSEN
jgi:hypothetical protein